MASAVEVDLAQLEFLLKFHRRMGPAIDTREIAVEIAARMREELDYEREAKLTRLYATMLADRDRVRVPRVFGELSTRRLLTQEWLDGAPLIEFERARRRARSASRWRCSRRGGGRSRASASFTAIRTWAIIPSSRRDGRGAPVEALNLYDYGCVRIFPPSFVGGVVELYRALGDGDEARIVHAYEIWGFRDSVAGDDRGAEHLGAVHLRAAARRSRAHDRRRREAGRLWPARDLRGHAGAQGRRRRPESAARIRLHGPRRDRPRRGLPAPDAPS